MAPRADIPTKVEFNSHADRYFIAFQPVHVHAIPLDGQTDADGAVQVDWQGRTARFVYEYKRSNSPKSLDTALLRARSYAKRYKMGPLVVAPFLSEEMLKHFESEKASAIDLSGNGLLLAPGLYVWRSGHPSRFKESATARNVYRGNSSILSRCLLLRRDFQSLTELRQFALDRTFTGNETDEKRRLTKGTVSKVVQCLSEDKIISHTGRAIQMLDPGRLLEKLRLNYSTPRGTKLIGKSELPGHLVWRRLAQNFLRYASTGDGAAERYGLLSCPDKLSIYVDDLERATEVLGVRETSVFPNIQLMEEKNDLVYFDCRVNGDERWASPIQTWLELGNAGPREQQAAGELEQVILNGGSDRL